jgi:RNA polymerase sigma-70 factor (ECF subfamily)
MIYSTIAGINSMEREETMEPLQNGFVGGPLAKIRSDRRPVSRKSDDSLSGSPSDTQQARLIQSIKNGDRDAFDRLFDLYSKRTFQIAYKLLRDRDEAEDAVQEVFLTVIQKAHTFRGNSQFSTWLHRLTVNSALCRLRRQKRRREVSYEDFLPQFREDGHHQVRPVVDWSHEVEERSRNGELQQILRKALDQLKPVDKAVVVLSDIEGFSDREIAKSVGLTKSAVKTRLHRARLFLRGHLAVHLGYSPT